MISCAGLRISEKSARTEVHPALFSFGRISRSVHGAEHSKTVNGEVEIFALLGLF
jgi:hypothetical protein